MAETKVRNREGEDIKGGFVPRDKKDGKREKGGSAQYLIKCVLLMVHLEPGLELNKCSSLNCMNLLPC